MKFLQLSRQTLFSVGTCTASDKVMCGKKSLTTTDQYVYTNDKNYVHVVKPNHRGCMRPVRSVVVQVGIHTYIHNMRMSCKPGMHLVS